MAEARTRDLADLHPRSKANAGRRARGEYGNLFGSPPPAAKRNKAQKEVSFNITMTDKRQNGSPVSQRMLLIVDCTSPGSGDRSARQQAAKNAATRF